MSHLLNHNTTIGCTPKKSRLHCWWFIIFAGFILLVTCASPTKYQQPWVWFGKIPSINFLSQNWKYTAEQYSAGDSLVIALVDIVRPNLSGGRTWTATIVSASSDSEEVFLFTDRVVPIPFGYFHDRFVKGVKYPTKWSTDIRTYNGVIDVISNVETLEIVYRQPMIPDQSFPDTLMILTARTTIRRH